MNNRKFEGLTDKDLAREVKEAAGRIKKATGQKERIEIEIRKRKMQVFPIYLSCHSAPHSVYSPLRLLGMELDKLTFAELPRRIEIGRSQYKFISRT